MAAQPQVTAPLLDSTRVPSGRLQHQPAKTGVSALMSSRAVRDPTPALTVANVGSRGKVDPTYGTGPFDIVKRECGQPHASAGTISRASTPEGMGFAISRRRHKGGDSIS